MFSKKSLIGAVTALGALAAIASASPIFEVIDISKNKSFGNDWLGCSGKAHVYGYADVDGPQTIDARVDGDLMLLDHDFTAFTARITGRRPGTSKAYVKLLGNTIWQKNLTGITSTQHISSPNLHLSVFGSSGVHATVPLGPFDLELRAHAGIASDVDFYFRTTSAPLVELNGGPRAWAYASGSVSVDIWIVGLGLEASANFSKVKLAVDATAKPTGVSGDAVACWDPYDLKIRAYIEYCGWFECVDLYEITLVEKHGTPNCFTLF
jgi:hypothetical protein